MLKGCVNPCLSADAVDGDVKGADLIYEPSLLCLPCTNLSATSQTHICGGGSASLCVSVRVYHLNFLPFIDLKTRFLCAGETTCGGGSAIHSISIPLYRSFFFFPPSPFLLFGGVISVYWVTRFPRVT